MSLPEKPALESHGKAPDGTTLYKMNILDLRIYMEGLRALKEEQADA